MRPDGILFQNFHIEILSKPELLQQTINLHLYFHTSNHQKAKISNCPLFLVKNIPNKQISEVPLWFKQESNEKLCNQSFYLQDLYL